jgi:SAM-dependent methyltransferase
LDNLSCHAGDLNNLAFESGSVESISCMHTIEHIGLGRYGDPLDYDGDLQALKELKRVVKKQGHLLIVVPVAGEAKICFNGHRVYSPEMIINFFKDDFQLKEFALIPEDEKDGGLIINPDSDIISKQNYGCGCFWFQKN